jgi:hypothetical protein
MNSTPNNRQLYYPTDEQPARWPLEAEDAFVPTAVQLERTHALERFNRLAIYVPLGLLVTAVLGFLIFLLVIAIWPPYEDTRLFLSGIADIILILFMLPVALILGLLLAGIFGGLIYQQQSRKKNGAPALQQRYGRLRLLLWKLDQKLSAVYRKADQFMPRLANLVIRFNTLTAYITTWLGQLTKLLKQHNAE